MDWKGLFKEWRIIVLLLACLGSIVAIGPHYEQNENGQVVIATNIEKGLDFTGGYRVLVSPKGNQTLSAAELSSTIQLLKDRISAFGLQQMDIKPVTVSGQNLIQIEASGINKTDLEELLEKQGRFEAKIPVRIGDKRQLTLYKQDVTLSESNQTLTVIYDGNKTTYRLGDSFALPKRDQSITLTYDYINESENQTAVFTSVFAGPDIIQVYTSSKARVTSRGTGWKFRFPLSIKKAAASQFKQVMRNLEVEGNHLESDLYLYLDGNLSNSLGIQSGLKGQLVTNPVVTGGANSKQQARREMTKLQSILRSGKLPVEMEVGRTYEVSQSMGQQRFRIALIAILLAVSSVSIVIFIRYRRPEVVLPVIITGFSEVLLIFGLAAAINWTIDLTAIAGIVAAVGTGVDDQVIITDESSKKEIKSLKKKIKKAFFIIFTAAASTIGVMLPLGILLGGLIKGFAITTILGVLIGVTITRPAYAKIIEYVD